MDGQAGLVCSSGKAGPLLAAAPARKLLTAAAAGPRSAAACTATAPLDQGLVGRSRGSMRPGVLNSMVLAGMQGRPRAWVAGKRGCALLPWPGRFCGVARRDHPTGQPGLRAPPEPGPNLAGSCARTHAAARGARFRPSPRPKVKTAPESPSSGPPHWTGCTTPSINEGCSIAPGLLSRPSKSLAGLHLALRPQSAAFHRSRQHAATSRAETGPAGLVGVVHGPHAQSSGRGHV